MRIAVAVAVASFLPAAGFAQGLTIEHRSVGCVVAGKYPVLNACFSPASDLARARVYFRATDSPHWYYVDMKSEVPCFTGTLPRPKKEIGGLSYYVEATDRAFNPARTDETATRVVGNQMECEKDVPVAPFVDKATVIVGAAPGAPIVPLGFAAGGGLPAAAAAGIVGAGAAGAGAVVASSTGGDGTTTTTTTPGSPTPTTPPTTTPPPTTPATTTPPPTTAPAANRLPTIVAEHNPPTGVSPLTVTFNLCRSSDPDNDTLRYKFDFTGDGTFDVSGSSCRESFTYRGSGGESFTAELCINDRVAGHEDVCTDADVELTEVVTCLPNDESAPEVEWLEPTSTPSGFLSAQSHTQALRVSAEDPSGVDFVDFYIDEVCADRVAGAAAAAPGPLRDSSGPPFAVSFTANDCSCYQVQAVATDSCGNQSEGDYVFFYTPCIEQAGTTTAVGWQSEMNVPGAAAQLVLNGSSAFFPGAGRTSGRATAKSGENRLEGLLVAATGTPGTWRLELSGEGSVIPGSLKVLAGEALAVDATGVTFRMQGRAGERVVVSFRTK